MMPTKVDEQAPVAPPAYHRAQARQVSLHIDAVRLVTTLHLLALCRLAVRLAHWRCPPPLPAGPGGAPRRYSEESLLLIALLRTLWRLSYQDIHDWLRAWPALASTCGLPVNRQGQYWIPSPSQQCKRSRAAGAPVHESLFVLTVFMAIRRRLIGARDLIIDSAPILAWRRTDPDAALGHAPAHHPRPLLRGYRVHTLLCRGSGLPVFYLLSPANVHDAPFAQPLLEWAVHLFHIRPRVIRQRIGHPSGISAAMLIGLVVVVIAGGILGSLSLLTHFGVLGARSGAATPIAVRGGIWTDDFYGEPDSLIPNGSPMQVTYSAMVDQALFLPLFYGDAQGVIHAGAATEVPTVQNGGISVDYKTWTFHLRPHLVWSDGQPYDARDVDYTWRLWANPKFGGSRLPGLNLITRTEVSADHLAISFHLKQTYAPFLSYWVDGLFAPLPVHHFSAMAPEQILKSPENLNPRVTSGPFLMSESVPGDHYTVVRNPRYYLTSEGLPYLDKVVFHIVPDEDTILKDLQAGTITSAWFLDVRQAQEYQRLTHYTLTATPTSSNFEALYFNFHNTVLARHLEVRQAIAMAIDHQALIDTSRHGFASLLCTDHPSALHPGYEPEADCPVFDPVAANKLLDDNGWARGPDGVRAKGGQRLEFEYSTSLYQPWRLDGQAIIQRNLREIGIKLDIQNYPFDMFFGPFLTGGKASPPTGAVAGRYDIAEFENGFGYDPNDSWLLACDQLLANGGGNADFYCNPALDALYRRELAIADPGLRQQIFHQIHQIYLTQFPFIVLYSPTDIAMVRKGTHNYQPGPFNVSATETINIWEWWCDNGKC